MTDTYERFKVIEGSQSAHCCFDATVIDTTRPVMIDGEQYEDQFEAVCECFNRADAERIALALNDTAAVQRERERCALAVNRVASEYLALGQVAPPSVIAAAIRKG